MRSRRAERLALQTRGAQRFLVLLRELPGQPCQPVCTRLAGCSVFGIRRAMLLTWWCATCWQMVDTGKLEVGFSPDVLRQIAEAEAARGGKTGESAEKAVGEISRQMVRLPCSMSLCREARPWQVVFLRPLAARCLAALTVTELRSGLCRPR